MLSEISQMQKDKYCITFRFFTSSFLSISNSKKEPRLVVQSHGIRWKYTGH